MKPTGQFQKWGVGVLGAISLVLIVRLVLQFNRGHAGVTRLAARTPPHPKASIPPSAKGAARKQRISDELSRYDSLVKLGLLKELEARPLPELHRNPFEFVAGRTPVSQNQGPGAPPAAPQPPPPPPPVTLKVMGYTEGKGGAGEAMVELCATNCEVSSPDDQVFVVHAGDSVGTRYKIIKITPTVVSAEDATLHQNVDLPVPQ